MTNMPWLVCDAGWQQALDPALSQLAPTTGKVQATVLLYDGVPHIVQYGGDGRIKVPPGIVDYQMPGAVGIASVGDIVVVTDLHAYLNGSSQELLAAARREAERVGVWGDCAPEEGCALD